MYKPSHYGHVGGGGSCCFCLEPITKKKNTKDGPIQETTFEMVSQSKVLPDATTTELSAQLAAGVPLEKVSSVMFGDKNLNVSQFPELTETPKADDLKDSKETKQNTQQQFSEKKGE